jgi:2-isopropylmalate synthase
MQGEGMSLSADEKVRVAHVLDALGVPVIEAGFPSSNPKEAELYALLERERLRADVAAFGMTRRRDVAAEADPALRQLAELFAPGGDDRRQDLEAAPRQGRARRSGGEPADDRRLGRFLVAQGKEVVYDAEHFFDAFREDEPYALRCLRAAAEAGAAWVTLCDTNGSSLPHDVQAATARARAAIGGVGIGIHAHNDGECGVANSLAAVRAGARMVQGTLNGYGERCGNANLVSIVPNLQLKMGHPCLPELAGLTEASHYVDELLNFVPDPTARTSARTPSRTRGACTSRASTPIRRPSSTSTRRRSATRARC